MRSILAIGLATIYGISLRVVFGFLDGLMGIMSVSFLIILPFIIGFLTVILIPKEKNRSATAAFLKPWLTSLAILIITVLFNIEGTICWVMIYPLFSILAGIGGVIAYNVQKRKSEKAGKSNWDEPNTLNVSLLFFVPCFIGVLEGDRTLTSQEYVITKQVIIAAPAKKVWKELTNASTVVKDDRKISMVNLMGFPGHIRTTLDTVMIGGKRVAYYEKGLVFQETISDYQAGSKLVLEIKTDPGKISPKVMDEHIVIGGKHVAILQDIYKLENRNDETCSLSLSGRFCINTPFNWYAGIWAKFLMGDILQGELEGIKKRVSGK